MINLLYIIEGGKAGGAEQDLLTVIEALDKTHYKVIVCLLKPSAILEEELKSLGIHIFILHMRGKWDMVSILQLAWFMRWEKIHIVHTSLYTSNTFGRIAAILARVPVIMAWEQGQILGEVPLRHCKADKVLSQWSDCIVACCQAAKEAIMKKEGIPAEKIRVIYNCVNVAKFTAAVPAAAIRSEFGIGEDDIMIGNVATLANEIKGQEYLIRAMPRIVDVFPKARLLLVGEGPSKEYFLELIKSLHLQGRVIVAGFRKDVPALVNIFDLYVCSSLREALSIAVLEAMALKKPVIATRVGGLLELVVENQTGHFVPAQDAESIAQAAIALLGNRQKMRQMGEAGFERARTKFTSDLIVKEMEALYQELSCKIHQRSQ